MQDAFKIRNFFEKLSAVTSSAENTESLKLLHRAPQQNQFQALQEVLVAGRTEEESSNNAFLMQDFGVGLPPLANSY
jgi:hypothetical protein